MASKPVYSIVNDISKGNTAVALKDIMPGELIVRESSPLLHVPKEFRSQSSGGDFLEVELAAYIVFANNLTRDQQEIILSLFGPTKGKSADNVRRFVSKSGAYSHLTSSELETMVKVLQVVTFNGFELESGEHAVYAEISRFSHSCQPNCSYSFRGKEIHCHARKHIKEGEELNLSYIAVRDMEPTHERRYKYIETKEFTCHCPRCDAIGDDTRQFDCCNRKCKGVMVVCQPINKRQIPITDLRYTGVEYVEPHLLPCTACHRTAPAEYQAKMFAIENAMLQLGPACARDLNEILKDSEYSELEDLLSDLVALEIQPRHAAAILLMRTEMMTRCSIMRQQGPCMVQETQAIALKYIAALENLFRYPTDGLCDGLGYVAYFCVKILTFSVFSPQQAKDICGKALRVYLLLKGRENRDPDWDEPMYKCHERLPSARSTEVCAFCEESPQRAALTLSRCGQCRQVTYCSAGCQKAHWKLHKKSCKAP